jgi:hypothetical protein
MDDFATVNGIYAEFFGGHKPARSAVEVARLPKDVLFEIEAIVRYVCISFSSYPCAHERPQFEVDRHMDVIVIDAYLSLRALLSVSYAEQDHAARSHIAFSHSVLTSTFLPDSL